MAKKLTYDELNHKCFDLTELLNSKDEQIKAIESQQYLGQRIEYLQGKVEVYERVMTWVESYFKNVESEE